MECCSWSDDEGRPYLVTLSSKQDKHIAFGLDQNTKREILNSMSHYYTTVYLSFTCFMY